MLEAPTDLQYVLKALAGKARMQILLLLGTHGDLSVGEVAEHMDLGISTVSAHLKELRRAGLVTHRKDGKHVYYGLDKPTLVRHLDALKDLLTCC